MPRKQFFYAVMIVVWAMFLVNYIVNVTLAGPTRAQWVRKNWYQIPYHSAARARAAPALAARAVDQSAAE